MADSDPISEGTPNKRRKLNNGKQYDSQNDSGEEFTVEDFHTAATMPLSQPQKRQLGYTKEQFHQDLYAPRSSSSTVRPSSPAHTYVTQPTQTLNATTQPTQPLPQRRSLPTSEVLVDRSSPMMDYSSPPRKPLPQPIKRPLFAKPTGLLASVMAPPGTAFRKPLGIQSKPAAIAVDSDDDEEEDPPVHYSDDEETQGLSSNLKPTNFKKGGRGLDSTPNRSESSTIVKESPRRVTNPNPFSALMSEFSYSSSSGKPADDLVSAYGSSHRRPRPLAHAHPQQTLRVQPAVNGNMYNTIADIPDYITRTKVERIQEIYTFESVQRCWDALVKNKGNVEDAMSWLAQDEEQDAEGEADELASTTPVAKRGVAVAKSQTVSSSQPVRPAAKQEVKAPSRTIAEKYASAQVGRRPSQAVAKVEEDEDELQPRRRLKQGRKAARSPTPPSSPPPQKLPQPLQRLKKQPPITIVDDSDESDSGVGRDASEEPVHSSRDDKLLKFLNECSVRDLTDLCAQPEDVCKFLLDKRPFRNLDVVRTISNVTTKSGKQSRSRAIGDKIVDICSEVMAGYDAVDELVERCEKLAQPIQEALKGWGVGAANDNGELQLMNLDEAHDSGIGTPASSCASEELAAAVPRVSKMKSNSRHNRFLGQPESMNSEATLKDYQLVGLNWLNLLWSKQISCILADDMGLGKTCQVIAFLAYLQQRKVDGVHLVIVPGSTLENWLREFAHFAPALNVVPYYGSQAERPEIQARIEKEFGDIDVVVTTYDMAVKPDDNKFLRHSINPMVCIYDEAHALRNPQSDRYRQLMKIPADFRVLLTGTPLQNNLQELVAILAFLMPDMFVDKQEELQYIFQHKASTKDADHAALLSTQRIVRARSIMTPFILRRKKAQVLELPTKHSRVEHCDMTPSQAAYYASLVDEAQQLFAEKGKKKGSSRASSNMLMALRKAAIHPLLARRIYNDAKIDKMVTELLKHDEHSSNPRDRLAEYLKGEHHQSFKGGDYGLHHFCDERPYMKRFALKKNQWMDAGKIELFSRLVTKYAANGDRVLVFSQFTTMMDILEAVLETLKVKFMRLDGSTNMQIRQDMIDQFTHDESITLFMLSTKAGGAGINLACANKVIILDSGFNPQDDIQAENRAHRVGQTREVEVVRLVTRGTIEEQIHALGESKLALDERVAGEGATAAEDKQAEKVGEQAVEKMFLDSLKRGEEKEEGGKADGMELKDAFKSGLEGAGVRVASKQAQF